MKKQTQSKKRKVARPRLKSRKNALIFDIKLHHAGMVIIAIGLLSIALLNTGSYKVGYAAVLQRFPGDPNPRTSGKIYWGASGDHVAEHESATGVSVSIRRTFYQWDNVTNLSSKLYTNVQDDLANNRLPLISFKTPGWQAVADGLYNTQIDAMLRKLDSYGKPIWLVAHHEPEGGGASGNTPDDPGGAPAWRAMQSLIRQRINATGVHNIGFMPILMSYTWDQASGRNPADWWVPGIWDAYFVDTYQQNEAATTAMTSNWTSFVQWIEAKNMPFGIGEWGNRGTNTQAANEMQAFWEWAFTNHKDILAFTYFDSGLNSPDGTWELTGEVLTKFRTILKNDSRVMRISTLTAPAPDTTNPTVAISSPSTNTVASGNLTVSAAASDNVGIKSVTLVVDNVDTATDTVAPFVFSLNTTTLSEGVHTLALKAVDTSNNTASSSAISITVDNVPATTTAPPQNNGTTTPSTTGTGTPSATPVTTISTDTTADKPIETSGDVITIVPSKPGGNVSVSVNGKEISGTSVDTKGLTNGKHIITVTEDGVAKNIEITVNNPWYTALVNEVKANPILYSGGGIATASIVWVSRRKLWQIMLSGLRVLHLHR